MKQQGPTSFKLDEIEKKNIFSVPENYFPSLTQTIENLLVELNPSLKKKVLNAPEGYFKQLPQVINEKIASENALGHPSLDQAVFATPDDYFDTIGDKIRARIREKDNVVKVDFASEFRYAIAASVALVLVASSLFFMLHDEPKIAQVETSQGQLAKAMIASLDKKEIRQYLEKQENVETYELIEFASAQKKQKINIVYRKH